MMPPQADYPFTYYLMVLIVFWYICLLWLYFHFILSMHFQFLVSARQCESHRVNPTEILFLWKEFITGQKARYIKQELHYSCISNNISENALLHIDLLGLKAYTQLVCAFYLFGSYGKVLAVSCIIFGRWLLLDLILSLLRDLPEPPHVLITLNACVSISRSPTQSCCHRHWRITQRKGTLGEL